MPPSRSPRTNGFVERFNGSVLDEFFRVKMRDTLYETVEALQADLGAWLAQYNNERPHSATETRVPTNRNDQPIRQTRRLRGHINAGEGPVLRQHRLRWFVVHSSTLRRNSKFGRVRHKQ